MRKVTLGFLFFSGIVGLTSCYKDPQPGTAKVIVVDMNDFRVPSANVTLYQDNSIIYNQGLTDFNGEYTYTFVHSQIDQGVEAIVKIKADKNGAQGSGIVRISPDKVTTQTVKIY